MVVIGLLLIVWGLCQFVVAYVCLADTASFQRMNVSDYRARCRRKRLPPGGWPERYLGSRLHYFNMKAFGCCSVVMGVWVVTGGWLLLARIIP